MERLRERLILARKALQILEKVLVAAPSEVERDAAIQRFEYTFEAIWKTAKQFLLDIEGLDIGSPKGVIRACREVGIFDVEETALALKMVDDRNMTVHTYNEGLANVIYERLKIHVVLLKNWLDRIEERMSV